MLSRKRNIVVPLHVQFYSKNQPIAFRSICAFISG
jgi:hypothetical protein